MENRIFDAIIIGAGPAGIFTALELTHLKPESKVLIVDMGRAIAHRTCPARTTGKCVHCDPCGIVHRLGGSRRLFRRQALPFRRGGRPYQRIPGTPKGAGADPSGRRAVPALWRAQGSPRPGRQKGGRNRLRSQPLQYPPGALPCAAPGHGVRRQRAGRHARLPHHPDPHHLCRADHRHGHPGGGRPGHRVCACPPARASPGWRNLPM